jgi:outer membrane protein assembly factor BamD (BamD/ComL family)
MAVRSILSVLFLSSVLTAPAEVTEKMVLKYHLNSPQTAGEFGEPGQVVEVVRKADGKFAFQLEGLHFERRRSWLFPFDAEITPSMVFVHLTRMISKRWSTGDSRHGYLLAKNVSELFPEHNLHEELLALQCWFSIGFDANEYDGKRHPTALPCLEEYRATYPNGRYLDQVQWELFRLETDPYEYEGYVPGILESVEAYEQFLVKYPDSPYSGDAQLKIARLYSMAAESAESEANTSTEESRTFREKASEVYRSLLKSEDVKTRETARVMLYQLEQGLRSYINPNSWF